MEAIRKTAQLLLLKDNPQDTEIESPDDWFIEKNLSPGGWSLIAQMQQKYVEDNDQLTTEELQG